MGFQIKTWKDRLVEFAGRRTLTVVSGSVDRNLVVDVTRNEGAVSQAGDAFSAANMNDLEQRIADAFGGFSFYPGLLTQAQYDALPDEIKAAQDMIFVIVKG